MRDLEFREGTSADAFDPDYVAQVECEVGVRFPGSYMSLMRAVNGGEPVSRYFLLGNNEKVVERFLSFVEDYKVSVMGGYDIEVVWSQIEDRLDEGVCPFAAVFAGDFLCFDGRQEGEPSIVLWEHDIATQGKPGLTRVAENFSDFINMLRT